MIGRSADGIPFSPSPAEPVRLIFLVVTPAESPSVQVFMLGQLARVAGHASLRERLREATSPSEIAEIITEANRHVPDRALSLATGSNAPSP
jgi:mannitol/fructose-specific phosphotransferase system IIA component (Ntr-type)